VHGAYPGFNGAKYLKFWGLGSGRAADSVSLCQPGLRAS